MRPVFRPRGPTLALLVLVMPLLAGCTAPGDGSGNGAHAERTWTNPYGFDVHFDGWRAYDDALAQIYTDPETFSGPRYRIPGTDTHQAVATELHAKLDAALRGGGGGAAFLRFSGENYYTLDLTPVQRVLCSEGDPARERVRGLEFINIVGRTSGTEIGVIIGAHWDSKRHADPLRDPTHEGEPILAADDGASGTAAVIELARAFAAEQPDVPVTFVLFDGEDGFDGDDCHPLAGSLHFAQSLTPDEKASTRGMILLDMVGNASATFMREAYSKRYCYTAPGSNTCGGAGLVQSAWLGDAVWATADAMGVEAFQDMNTGAISDDHIPFLHDGIYAVDIIRYENAFAEYWHTTRDDHTAIQPEGIDQVGAVVEATVRRLAASDAWGPDQAM